jgi:hypothetical protein
MKEKPQIQYFGKTIFTEEEVKILQQLKDATEHFEEKIEENSGKVALDDLGRVFPSKIRIDFERRCVDLLMNNYQVGQTTEYGDYIRVRRTNSGFIIGNNEVPEVEIKQAIDRQLEQIIK